MALTKITRAILDTGVSDNSDATAITIDSSERVGIGTTSPGKNLEVNDSSVPTIRFARSNSFYWDLGHTSSQFQFNSQTGGTIMQLNYDGNVGVGTDNPLTIFHTKTSDATSNNNAGGGFYHISSATSGTRRASLFLDADNGNFSTSSDGAYAYIEKVGGGGNLNIRNQDNSPIAFYQSSSENLRVHSSGGITFNGDTATANALNDYEEGIHVATITCGTSGSVTLNGAYSDISYTKVGRLVTVTGFVIVSSVSSPVGYYTISLPFTAANLTDRAGDATVNIMHHYGNNAKPSDIVAFLPQNSSIFYVYRGDVGVNRSETAAEELRASTQIMFTVSYNTA